MSAGRRVLADGRQREVVEDRERLEDALGLAVARHVGDAVARAPAAASRWPPCRRRRRAAPGRGRAGRGRRACARSAPARGPRAPPRRRSRRRARRSRSGRWRRAARRRRAAARPVVAVRARRSRASTSSRADMSCSRRARRGLGRGRALPTTSPLRSTVLRSAISCSSSMRCEMKTTAVPRRAAPAHLREQAVAGGDVERRRRLVQDQHLRLLHERARDDDDLALAELELLDGTVERERRRRAAPSAPASPARASRTPARGA